MDLDEMKAVLERRREELTERRERLARHTRHREEPLSADFAEQAVELENAETLVALDHEVHAELREIERALRRLGDGSFGECTGCGEPVGEPRLRAVPYASLCIACANKSASSGANRD
ncbi:MAG: TraR/DksA family transcriptional regulator [Pseudomonadales bacterium]